MLQSTLLGLLIGTLLPSLGRAQSDYKSDARPTTTIRSTVTVVPVAASTDIVSAEALVFTAYDDLNTDTTSSEAAPEEPTEPTTEALTIVSAAPVADIPLNFSSEANASEPNSSKMVSSASSYLPEQAYATSYPAPSGAPIFHLPKPYYKNFTLPSTTHPVFNASLPLNGTNTTCSISNPTCPACNNQTLTDIHNVTYTVLCGHSLDATLDYAFGEPLPAAWCMARCDERNVTCLGASWSTEECVLALGQLVGKIEDPDHMAFLRVAAPPIAYPPLSTGSLPRPPISTGLSYSNISYYPAVSSFATTVTPQTPVTSSAEADTNARETVTVSVTITDTASLPEPTNQPEPDETDATVTVTVYTYGPSKATSVDGRPQWAGGNYGVDEGGRHHGRPASWRKGDRPPWSGSGWGWKFSSWFNHKDDRE